MELTCRSIIGTRRGAPSESTFNGFAPVTGQSLAPDYHVTTDAEMDEAVRLASAAFVDYGRMRGAGKGAFLRKIAANIEAISDAVIERATLETALPAGRIQGEMARTCNQLRMFADLVEEGSWVDARIDPALPARLPLPRPDIRSLLRPLGPVAVFGASNFPLAFSVAGGDTASAFAAGCPVVVKAHPAHPGTSELAGLAIQAAARDCGLPEGVFSLLFAGADARGNSLGAALVSHPLIKAVAFTGSRTGGRALMAVAARREEPIPFYAEMSSINPVFILPGAMRARAGEIASGLHASVTLGAGQFCTNPGLVVMARDDASRAFAAVLAEIMRQTPPFIMLTPGISATYGRAVDERDGDQRLQTLARQPVDAGRACEAGAALFKSAAQSFLASPELSQEVFGPSTLLVEHDTREQLLEIAHSLEGHLTATVHGSDEDLREYSDLLAVLEAKVGRLVFNGFPTGVEVSHAIVHGGPYPATSDGRSTSVGTRAILRFGRPVCYQGFPDHALPDELKNDNPLGIWRMIDGQLTRDICRV